MFNKHKNKVEVDLILTHEKYDKEKKEKEKSNDLVINVSEKTTKGH